MFPPPHRPVFSTFSRFTLQLGWLFLGGLFLSPVAGAMGFEISRDDNRILVTDQGREVLRYRFNSVPHKPYLEELYSPSGKNVLRDSPEDHKHHHGLMFAIAVDGVNFWEEQTAPGDQRHADFSTLGTNDAGDIERAFWVESLEWVNPADQQLLLLEERSLETVHWPEIDANLLTWQSRFTLPAGKATANLSGSKYFGLGVRFPAAMDQGDKFLNSEGGTQVVGTNDQRAKWCAYSADLEGAPVTVAVFDHPKSFRFPAKWYTMNDPFSYLSATLGLDLEPAVLKSGEELVVRYGAAVWDGERSHQEIHEIYRKWCESGR